MTGRYVHTCKYAVAAGRELHATHAQVKLPSKVRNGMQCNAIHRQDEETKTIPPTKQLIAQPQLQTLINLFYTPNAFVSCAAPSRSITIYYYKSNSIVSFYSHDRYLIMISMRSLAASGFCRDRELKIKQLQL